MRLTKKSAYQWLLLTLKLFPVIVLAIGSFQGAISLTDFNSYWCDFAFTSDIVEFFENVGITMNTIGVTMIGYFNYLVMLHLLECLAEVVFFLPHLFIDFIDKLHCGGDN